MEFDLEKMKGKVVHCNTEEKAKKLLKFLHGQGYKWQSNGMLLYTNWSYKKEKTCYKIKEDDYTIRIFNIDDMVHNKILEFEDTIIQDKPKICEILGIELNTYFNIKEYEHNPCKIKYSDDKDDECKKVLVVNKNGKVSHTTLTNLIEHPELIEKVYKYTDKQKEIFKALKLLEYKFIVKSTDTDNQEMLYACRVYKYLNKQTEVINLNNFKNDFDFIKIGEIFGIPNII